LLKVVAFPVHSTPAKREEINNKLTKSRPSVQDNTAYRTAWHVHWQTQHDFINWVL